MKLFLLALLTLVTLTAPAFATVNVSVPYNHQVVGSWIQVVAKGNTPCSMGVSAMGVYINNKLVYVENGASMNHWLPVNQGWNHLVVTEWDFCGGSTNTAMDVNFQGQADGVKVTSPAANSTVGTQVSYVASATSSCSKGVASMGIYVNNNLVYVVQGNQLNHQIMLGAGKQHTVVQDWDYCGGSNSQPVDLNVSAPASNPGTTLWNLQSSGAWRGWAQFPPNYSDCEGNCPGLGFSLQHNVSSPSYSGHSAKFSTWGTRPYGDVLWNLPVLGDLSAVGKSDTSHTLLPKLHHFTYEADVYVTNLAVTQVLEFDFQLDMYGHGMLFGTECNHLGGGTWDVWDNQNARWTSAGIPCKLQQGWNHVKIQVQRSNDNRYWLYYQSITLNGETYQINRWYPPFQVPGGWWGISLNYQMDGNVRQTSNTTYVDNMSFNYW